MLNKLTSRIYYMDYIQRGDRPILGLIVDNNYSLIIDGGNSKAHCDEFLDYITGLDIPKIEYLVLTHWHWDHVVGIAHMKKHPLTKDIKVIANKSTRDKLSWMRELEWTDEAIRKRVVSGEEIEFCEEHIKVEHSSNERNFDISNSDIIFEDKLAVDLGAVTVQLEKVHADYSEDCTLVNIKEEKVVFMGDTIYLDMYNGPWSYSREKLYPLLDRLKFYNANYYVPAHHPKYSNEEFNRFIKDMKSIGDLVNEKRELKEAIDEFERKFKKTPVDFDLENVTAFIEGNLKK